MKKQKDKMHTGELYISIDKEIAELQLNCLEKLYEYNHSHPKQKELRTKLLKDMFAEIGENCYIEPPFHSNFGARMGLKAFEVAMCEKKVTDIFYRRNHSVLNTVKNFLS